MRNQQGKFNISALLVFILIFYGGFVAFKFITVRITKGQIKNDVINRFGFVRGPDFSVTQGKKIIREVLVKHGILPATVLEDEEEVGDDTGEGSIGEETAKKDEGSEDIVSKGDSRKKNDKTPFILVKFDERKRYVKFQIRYDVEIDLILFKSQQVVEIQEQILNYN